MIRRPALKVVIRTVISVLFLVGFSILMTWFIYLRQNMMDLNDTWEFITEKPAIFWYSSLVIFFLVSTLTALLWRPFLAGGIFFAGVSILTYIHMQKFSVRAAPLLPEDFQLAASAGELMQFIDPWSIVRLVLGVLFVLFGSALLERCFRRVFQSRSTEEIQGLSWWQRFDVVPRLTLTMASLAGFVLSTDFIVQRSSDSAKGMKWLGSELVAWNQTENYERNGFIIGFIYNLGGLTLPEPDDYSEDRIAEIVTKYQKIQAGDTARKDIDDTVDNVIVILCETFYDPELLTELYEYYGNDVTPNLRWIFEKYPSGYMYSPEYGGNTANIEFEVFSGLSNYWANTIQYVNTVPKLDNLDTIASWTGDFNFDTTAIHAYDGSMYKRSINYPKMGFDEFIDDKTMKHTERENKSEYINDRSVYAEIIDIIKDNPGKQMVGAVTMQNHAPYWGAEYKEHDYTIVEREEEELDRIYQLEDSYQSLHYADEYIGDFLKELDELDEKTVVLWFGDHAAGVLDRYVTSEDKGQRDLAHLTPYFVYTNFKLPVETDASAAKTSNLAHGFSFSANSGVDLPTTTPNCLSNTLYNLLNVKKPALMYLLDEICTETPILTRTYYTSEEPEASEALREYELLNYDVQSGEYYYYDINKHKK